MKNNYHKHLPIGKRLVIYGVICFLVVVVNAANLTYAFLNYAETEFGAWLITPCTAFFINCIGIIYSIAQDIRQIYQAPQTKFVFNNKNDIPFIDREALIAEVLSGVSQKIAEHKNYYTKNIRYGVRNGKTSFAQRLCWELQCIKDKKSDNSMHFDPRVASRIGRILLINYTAYRDSFEAHIKSNYTYVKGKINLVVVTNFQNTEFPWSDSLEDSDIFFVFLNFNTSTTSENALFFADDKIVNLLYELRNVSAFTALVSGKTQSEIEAIAAKLGSLSHNNIGVIVDLLTSNDFSLLLEMDAPFVDFYLALRRGQYDQAEKFYCALPSFPPQNNAIRYKTEYERANLDHFLGKYEETYESLNRLMAEVCCDGSFINSRAGEALYFDIVLLQSHVLKHMGRFSEATQTLSQVGEEYRNTIWLRAHFSVNILQLNELTQPCPEWGILLRDLDQKMRQFKSTRQLINSDYYFYEAFYPIVKFYTDHFDRSSIPSLIEIEEHAIAYYEVQERRYLTNCYFIKAELLRISERWKEAEKYYNLCYDIYCNNGDKDILFLVAFTCKCVQCFEAVSLNIPFDWDEAISECKQRDGYGFHQRLISQMELAISNKDFCKGWLSHYRVTITPIP